MEKQWRKVLEDMLEQYPIYAESIRNDEFLYPQMVASFSERVAGGVEYSDPTTRIGQERAKRSVIVNGIDRALGVLSPEERVVIEKTYFPYRKSALYVCRMVGVSESTYHLIKRRAMQKMGRVLGLPV